MMAMRQIIMIDEYKCNGCGNCVPNCQEGALQIIDGKARLISDLFCDGLGACVGHCPQEAITVIEREAEPYDERKVMAENIVPKGVNTIKAHMSHLRDHGATKYLDIAKSYLKENGLKNPLDEEKVGMSVSGCPGSRMMQFSQDTNNVNDVNANFIGTVYQKPVSQLRQWPIQLHLVSPQAPYYEGADVLLAADCTAYAIGDFHGQFMKGKSLAIACPKLDHDKDIYVDKITSMIDDAKINTLTVAVMQVPCCSGLVAIANEALANAKRKIPVKRIVVGIQGQILNEDWI